MNGIDVKFDLPTDAEIERMFDMAGKLDRYKVADQVVRAAAQPVLQRARELCPRQTGRDKRSLKQRGEARWNIPLWKTIKMVVRKYSYSSMSVIGPEWPTGNKAYFNTSPKGRVQVLWGKRTGKIVAQIRNWIVQAFDETKPAQTEAIKSKLRELCDRMFRGAA
jgi:hypothetical protein